MAIAQVCAVLGYRQNDICHAQMNIALLRVILLRRTAR
jgi:hypothetical protein